MQISTVEMLLFIDCCILDLSSQCSTMWSIILFETSSLVTSWRRYCWPSLCFANVTHPITERNLTHYCQKHTCACTKLNLSCSVTYWINDLIRVRQSLLQEQAQLCTGNQHSILSFFCLGIHFSTHFCINCLDSEGTFCNQVGYVVPLLTHLKLCKKNNDVHWGNIDNLLLFTLLLHY